MSTGIVKSSFYVYDRKVENSDLDNKKRFTDILEHIVIDLVCGFMGVEGVIKSGGNFFFLEVIIIS